MKTSRVRKAGEYMKTCRGDTKRVTSWRVVVRRKKRVIEACGKYKACDVVEGGGHFDVTTGFFNNLGNQAGARLGKGGPLPGEQAHSRVRYCPARIIAGAPGPRLRGAAGAKKALRGAAGALGAAGVQEAPSWCDDVSERVCVRVTRASTPTALKIVCETVSGVWWDRRVRTLSANRRVTDALKVQTRSQCT